MKYLDDGHYTKEVIDSSFLSKLNPVKKKAKKYYFTVDKIENFKRLIESEDPELQLLAFNSIITSKTAKHYQKSFDKYARGFIEICTYHLKQNQSVKDFYDKSYAYENFVKWINNHTIFVRGSENAL